MPAPQIILKPRYYLDHFDEMVEFLEKRYAHAFTDSHRAFLSDFAKLSLDARCLYVRFANRKGRIFFREYLRYEEINHIEDAAQELAGAGFIRTAESADFEDLLVLQTRPVLVQWIRDLCDPDELPKLGSAKKRDLVRFGRRKLPFERCFPEEDRKNYLVQDRYEEVEYLLFLYFGKLRDGLTTFALRDLGVVKPAGFRSDFEARFETREAALVSYHYEKTLIALREIDGESLEGLYQAAGEWPEACDLETTRLRTRAVQKLGRALERAGDPARALRIYRMSNEFPATERSVRLLFQLDRKDEAKAALEKMIDDPSCDEELLFAEDFYARKFQSVKVGRLTALLREATVMKLDESGLGFPEAAAVKEFSRRGIEAWHTENILWQQLFGLLFWDLLFGASSAPLHNTFDFRPRGLDSGEFAARNTAAIAARLELIGDREGAIAALTRTWQENEGTSNGLIPWYPDVFACVLELIRRAPPGSLREILGEMVRHHKANRSGFPDLLILENGNIRFAEIKTVGDKLQRHQLAQLERLRRLGFPVEVIRVEWTVDPEQEYVVVDVETTGGNAQWNRVTEIGAVKVKGNRIIDEWSTLLHPGRPIPKKIVELTGITDEMVADAPRFEDIAEEFLEFLGDCVFTAHRAAFDFAFIQTEFGRVDIDFRAPTLCTVVAMKRYFPGLPSYGLARLCDTFGIELASHHRALCDAKATAALLLKINEKRLSESEQ